MVTGDIVIKLVVAEFIACQLFSSLFPWTDNINNTDGSTNSIAFSNKTLSASSEEVYKKNNVYSIKIVVRKYKYFPQKQTLAF